MITQYDDDDDDDERIKEWMMGASDRGNIPNNNEHFLFFSISVLLNIH